jgi:hypothetical protein
MARNVRGVTPSLRLTSPVFESYDPAFPDRLEKLIIGG